MAGGLIDEPRAWKPEPDPKDPSKSIQLLRVFNGELRPSIDYDTVEASYPNDETEIYTYILAGSSIRTVTVTYLTSTKELIDSVVFS